MEYREPLLPLLGHLVPRPHLCGREEGREGGGGGREEGRGGGGREEGR